MKKRGTDAETESKIVVKDGAFHFEQIPKWKVPHTFHTSKTFMDYLHGDVAGEDFWLACQYEYARESESFWTAAAKRDECLKRGQDIRNAAVSGYYEAARSLPHFAGDILRCLSFPKKDWQELSEDERNGIMLFWPSNKIRPLTMRDAWHLKSRGILDRFTKMGEDAKPVVENVPPGQWPPPMKLVWPILELLESQPYFQVIFQVDFSKGEQQLVDEFREWLRLPDNKARLKQFKKSKVGTTGKALDRLKDLAAWRLFREMGKDWNTANNFANKHRKERKPFHNARRQGERPANEADLFGEEADARRTKKSAYDYLREIMPLDFPPPPNPFMAATIGEIEKACVTQVAAWTERDSL